MVDATTTTLTVRFAIGTYKLLTNSISAVWTNEFTLAGAGASGVTLGAPVKVVAGDDSSSAYSYAVTGTFQSGTVVVHFIEGSWSLYDATPQGNASTPVKTDGADHVIDVTYAAPDGYSVDESTISTHPANDISISGLPAGVALADVAPVRQGTTNTWRYKLTGTVTDGAQAIVSYVTGGWAFKSKNPTIDTTTAPTFTGTRYSFKVLGNFTSADAVDVTFDPTKWDIAETAGPGLDQDVTVAAGATTITVAFPTHTGMGAGTTLAIDPASVADAAPEFTLTDAAGAAVALSSTVAPTLVTGTTDQWTYTLDAPAAAGTLHVTLTPGSWSFAENVPVGTVAGGTASFVNGAPGSLSIDIRFPVAASQQLTAPGPSDFDWIVLGGPGLGSATINTSVAPQLQSDGVTVRYALTGALASSGVVTVAFLTSNWTTTAIGGTSPRGPPLGETTKTLGSASDPNQNFLRPGFSIDVAFPVAAGFRLDAASLATALITLGGAGLGTLAIDTSVAPQLLGDGTTVRYRITGQASPTGDITATFAPGSWSIVDPTGTGVHSLGDLSSLNDRSYIDVAYTVAPKGGAIDAATINGDELTLTGDGHGTAAIAAGAPTTLANGRYRYYVTGHFGTGTVTVTFAQGSFTETVTQRNDAGTVIGTSSYGSLQATQDFTVLGPTAVLQDPVNGGITGPAQLNDRGFIDVAFVAPAGKEIDLATITDAAPEFDLVGPSTLSIDATQAPVLVSRVGQTWTFRYWTLGSLASGQSLTVRFKTTDAATGFAYTDGTVNTFEGPVAPVNLTVGSTTTPNVSWIDLLINPAAGDQLIASSITPSALHLAGAGATGVQLAPIAPMQIAGTSICRFFVLGSFAAGGVTLDIDASRFASNPTATRACRRSSTPPATRASPSSC